MPDLDQALMLAVDLPPAYFLAPIGAIAALIMAFLFSRSVMSRSEGDEEMITIAQAVRDGAMAYLKRQYFVVAGVFIALVVVLFVLSFLLGLQPRLSIIGVPIAGFLSGLCGWFGMKMATNASARTAYAAKSSLNDGLTVAFRSGAVMGLIVVGFALLDASVWFFVLNTFGSKFGIEDDLVIITTIMLSFGMGASTQALFARVGGGIYTKAADVGADLVGKVEAGIPEDDARNPATIADNVGDNVGDVAGMGADLYESYYGSILATMALGASAAFSLHLSSDLTIETGLLLATAPLALAGLGILCSIIGIFTVRAKEGASFAQLLKGLHMGVYVASGLSIAAAFGLLYFLFDGAEGLKGITTPWGIGLSIVSGLVAGLVIAHATEYYTSYEHPPTRRIAQQAVTGPATVIIAGIAEGMKSTWASLLTVVVAIIASFSFSGGGENFLMGLYGVGIAAVGMLATLGITLATDAYGPIADNAGGNAEMSGQPPHVRERTDMLDSLGNTTAATGKGFAIGSAALTALALFAAFVQIVQAQIGEQAKSYVQTDSVLVARADTKPYAVYQGHNKFAVVVPGQGDAPDYIDGAMLIATQNDAIADNTIEMSKVAKGDIWEVDSVDFSGTWKNDLSEGELAAKSARIQDTHRYRIMSGNQSLVVVSAREGTLADVLAFYEVHLLNPRLLGGLFIGVLLAFLFCALTMNAVGRAAYEMMGECRRQFGRMRQAFREQGMSADDIADPTKWPKRVQYDGIQYPDYAKCVSISTAGAQKEMVVPAMLAIVIPIVVGMVLSVPGVVGMLAGGLTSGFAVAIFMANAGGAWDNAKKLIESYGKITAEAMLNDPKTAEKIPGEIREAIRNKAKDLVDAGKPKALVYGKGSEDHKATVVGDTVGDPFKDTSGPSLNILIKLISIVSVVFAGLTVAYGPMIGSILGID